MRNTAFAIATLVLSAAAWAVNPGIASDPIVGPGKAGAAKDEKGHVKGTDSGAGPHKHFNQQFERRVDRPEEAIEKEQKEKAEKAKREEAASKPAR